jgi:hypothetical protein
VLLYRDQTVKMNLKKDKPKRSEPNDLSASRTIRSGYASAPTFLRVGYPGNDQPLFSHGNLDRAALWQVLQIPSRFFAIVTGCTLAQIVGVCAT